MSHANSKAEVATTEKSPITTEHLQPPESETATTGAASAEASIAPTPELPEVAEPMYGPTNDFSRATCQMRFQTALDSAYLDNLKRLSEATTSYDKAELTKTLLTEFFTAHVDAFTDCTEANRSAESEQCLTLLQDINLPSKKELKDGDIEAFTAKLKATTPAYNFASEALRSGARAASNLAIGVINLTTTVLTVGYATQVKYMEGSQTFKALEKLWEMLNASRTLVLSEEKFNLACQPLNAEQKKRVEYLRETVPSSTKTVDDLSRRLSHVQEKIEHWQHKASAKDAAARIESFQTEEKALIALRPVVDNLATFSSFESHALTLQAKAADKITAKP